MMTTTLYSIDVIASMMCRVLVQKLVVNPAKEVQMEEPVTPVERVQDLAWDTTKLANEHSIRSKTQFLWLTGL